MIPSFHLSLAVTIHCYRASLFRFKAILLRAFLLELIKFKPCQIDSLKNMSIVYQDYVQVVFRIS